ncbi:TPA: AlwI family type II restriction endonuclease [Vibrio cholerae]|uniref:AlwI family type II restriction endonuclease n=1 Tax=Vibrio cincinnatiensis TaxID=675 RepID=UPI0036F992FA
MHRFPNPGSDIKNSIDSLKFLMENIDEAEYFDLFDMKELLVLNGFISSSGATGIQALQKSENTDRSRDQTFNQCKMYSEIFRAFGWTSSAGKQNNVHISLLGKHALNSKVKPQTVFSRCLLGLENPNDILDIKLNYKLRPFLAILNCADKLGGYISRDEMIYGPLFLRNDKDDEEINSVCSEILSFREEKGALRVKLEEKIKARADETGKSFSYTTAGNYTRFPIAAIQWVNWFKKNRNNTYSLTDNGKHTLAKAREMDDTRYCEITDDEYLTKLAIFSYYQMLVDFGYNLESKNGEFYSLRQQLPKEVADNGTLFNPFCTINNEKLAEIFSFPIPNKKRKTTIDLSDVTNQTNKYPQELPFKLTAAQSIEKNTYSEKLLTLLEVYEPKEVARQIKEEVRSYKKEEFYPWIADVFAVLGLTCNIPQHGNNSVRWDAVLLNDDITDSIPIELKSPTEEIHISTKAIRQALENKIVLQSRKALKNNNQSTSLAIGYELPNKRSEVEALINAFETVYGFKIAVIGTDYLIRLTIQCIQERKQLSFSDFTNLRGIIND